MATDKFLRCDAVTSRWEGGNVDHPDDPGGRTSRGVTQARYDEYRDGIRQPRRSVYEMSEYERQAIFHNGYWLPVRADYLQAGVDLATYDAAVNSGPRRGARWLQQGINDTAVHGKVAVDGAVGPNTVGAAGAVRADKLVSAICARRMSFVTGLAIFKTFGRGWTRRIADIEARGVAWAMEGSSLAPNILSSRQKGASEAADRRQKQAATAGTGGAAGAGGGEIADLPIEAIAGLIVFALVVAGILWVKGKAQRDRAEAFRKVREEIEA